MKIYVTKYLFTEGIQEFKGKPPPTDDGFFYGAEWLPRDSWHRTREAALAHAEVMRTKKLAALDKQRKKIEAMAFG